MRALLFLLVAVSPVLAEVSSEVLALKAKRDAKVAEIDQAYRSALARLMDRYAAEGDGDKAAEVKKLIEKPDGETATNEAEDDARLKPLVGVWKRDTDNGLFTMKDTKGGTFNGNMAFTLSFDAENNRVTVIGSHWADNLTFTTNPDVVHGSTLNNGKLTRYKLKRIK